MSDSKKHASLMNLKPNLPQLKMTKPIEEVERMLLSSSEPASSQRNVEPDRDQKNQIAILTKNGTNVDTNVKPSGHLDQLAGASFVLGETKEPVKQTIRHTGEQENLDRLGEPSATANAARSFPDEAFIERIKRARGPVAFVGFKIPADLKDELEKVARFNGTDMTKIVVEGLKLILPHLPHPPK